MGLVFIDCFVFAEKETKQIGFILVHSCYEKNMNVLQKKQIRVPLKWSTQCAPKSDLENVKD